MPFSLLFEKSSILYHTPHKLHAIGLDPSIMSWVHSHLAYRHQFVAYNGAASDTSLVVSGVLQGSILGPLLVLILEDICQVNLSLDYKLVLYADEILLYRPISSSSDHNLLQADID